MSSSNSDEEFERRIRDVLNDRQLAVPPAPDALDRVHSGAKRRQQRRSAGAVLGAVAIIGIAAAAVSLRPQSHSPRVAADHSPSPSLLSASSAPASSPVASADPKPFASNGVVLPSSSLPSAKAFSPLSVTAIGPTTYWVLLGGGDCDCTKLETTTDGGHTFTALQAPGGMGAKGWTATVVRFANPTEGWAFLNADNSQPSLFTTTDGGRSWSETKQFAGRVVDLVAANGKAWAVVDTTPYNQQVPEQYALYTTNYSQPPEVWTRVALPIDLGSALPSIVDQDGTVTVLASGPTRTSGRDHTLISVAGAPFTDHMGPCTLDGAHALSNSAKAIWVSCPAATGQQLALSTDRGVTWKAVPFASVLPDTDGNGLGAIDDHTAVVYDADQASASSRGLVTLSADGSVIHHTAAIQSPTFVGFTTPQIGFAIDTRLWRTTDGGATWAVVPVGS